MRPAYIAAPYAAGTAKEIDLNVRRAAALARLATEEGYAPICVHPAIQAGAYGDDTNPAHRERGLQVCEALVAHVAQEGGVLFMLLRDDGTMSAGVRREADVWGRHEHVELSQYDRTWQQWRSWFCGHGLLGLWQGLAAPEPPCAS